MSNLEAARRFCNNRQWRDFISALQHTVAQPRTAAYPKIIGVLRVGRARLNKSAVRASSFMLSPQRT
jgi:hypothetical protein